jgi:vitamin B12 transporter
MAHVPQFLSRLVPSRFDFLSVTRSAFVPRSASITRLALLAVVVCLAGSFGEAIVFAQGHSRITGVVFDSAGGTIAGARVTLRDTSDGVVAFAITDARGAFEMPRPAPGRYEIDAAADLFQTVRRALDLTAASAAPIELSLTPTGLAESVVVTARRVDVRRAEVPQKIEVVDETDLERTVAVDLTDLLKKNAGVDVIQYSGALSGVGIRGFRPQFAGLNKRSLLLIDGRPSGVTNLATLTLDGVARVEVLKGAASAIYGSSAMGGVVNVLTRQSRGRIGGEARLGLGSFRTSDVRGRIGGSLSQRWDFDLAGTLFNQRDDFRMGNGVVRPSTRFHTYDGSARVGVDLSAAWRVDASASGYLGRDIHTPGDIASGLSSQGSKDLERSSQDVRLRARLNRHDASLTIYRAFDAGHTTNVTSANPLDQPFLPFLSFEDERTWIGAQLRDAWRWSRRNSLIAGLDLETVDATSRSFSRTGAEQAPFSANADKRTAGLYAENSLTLGAGRTVVTAGGRWDRIATRTRETPLKTNFVPSEAVFDVFNPSVGVKHELVGGLRLHATAGRAFIPPEAIMLTGFTTTTVGGRTQVSQGNPNLRPERSTSFDAGLEWSSAAADVDVTYFQTVVRDRFVTNVVIANPPPPEPIVVSVVNALDAHIHGLEVDVRRQAGRHAGVFANLTHYFTRTEQPSSGAAQDILNVPLDTIRAGVDVGFDRLTARLSGRFVHGRKDNDFSSPGFPIVDYDDFAVIDLTARYALRGPHAVLLSVSNLGDTYYYEKIGFPLQGRTASVKYQVGF